MFMKLSDYAGGSVSVIVHTAYSTADPLSLHEKCSGTMLENTSLCADIFQESAHGLCSMYNLVPAKDSFAVACRCRWFIAQRAMFAQRVILAHRNKKDPPPDAYRVQEDEPYARDTTSLYPSLAGADLFGSVTLSAITGETCRSLIMRRTPVFLTVLTP